MEYLNVKKEDFESIYNTVKRQYNIGNIDLMNFSKIIMLTENLGFSLDYKFDIIKDSEKKDSDNKDIDKKDINKKDTCNCSNHPKIFKNYKWCCQNCLKPIRNM